MAKGMYQKWLEENNLKQLEAWRRDGLKYEQIAKNMGITEKTLYEWQNKHSAICEALKKGKEVADIEVENATFKSALGFHEKVTKPIKVTKKTFDEETGKIVSSIEEIKYVEEDVYFPPNMTAAIFWLKNRKPNEWKDRNITVGTQKPDAEEDDFSKSIRESMERGNV